MPKVSIVLPTYNGHQFINRAIGSVFEQTYVDWELIIIDDGSSPAIDATIEKKYLDDSRVRVLKNEKNLRIQKTLNRGLKESKGEYVARLDDDDWWNCKDKLQRQVEFLDSNPDIGVVGTGAIIIDKVGNELFKYELATKDSEIRRKILKKNPYIHASVMFRKDLVVKLGGYSESEETLHLEDYDLWLRVGGHAKFAGINHNCTSFLLDSGGISSQNKKEQLSKNTKLIKKYGKNYPGYSKYLIFSYIRNVLYVFYNLMPKIIKVRIFSIYKRG
ncbi:MAG: hypothetical protein COT89_00785 [Candidatus Colwellbacteria bacterium CG10_big_fil_rev_8_21_14_0_10_42_22]|uniref:Glycosyltransferase 2-like domain-containing protein n=1 Tax=Candidatus Colwellbacteria bacterium CG10_big_fil_rev_8_21_14_0_10_42_22 TaxID=1974540 RepID=A0A2H0VIP9_9BACT|nr:MAG: hypothetical protein COT89_00785 [Candidatus Colwellbacteria bacterium CG10_big_fil_rev_8_21_14_0_10_42_22]